MPATNSHECASGDSMTERVASAERATGLTCLPKTGAVVMLEMGLKRGGCQRVSAYVKRIVEPLVVGLPQSPTASAA
jgi:hypothetical protein